MTQCGVQGKVKRSFVAFIWLFVTLPLFLGATFCNLATQPRSPIYMETLCVGVPVDSLSLVPPGQGPARGSQVRELSWMFQASRVSG